MFVNKASLKHLKFFTFHLSSVKSFYVAYYGLFVCLFVFGISIKF